MYQNPNPEGAVKAALETSWIANPYVDRPDRQFEQSWHEGFADACRAEYLDRYVYMVWEVGQGAASKVRLTCQSAGYDDAMAGNSRDPAKLSSQMAHNQKFYHVLTDSAHKNRYEAGFVQICEEFYITGYDKGEKELKEESDLALAKEVGDQLGIKEEDVVEFFGGEEGVEQAYRENCVIATATYGSPMAKEVQMLREIRDNQLLKTQSGSAFMGGFNTVYYSFAPTIAQWEHENPAFKQVVKTTITPLITSLSLLNHVSMDSEAEVLGYGISIILLNIGMYVGIPAIVVVGITKRF